MKKNLFYIPLVALAMASCSENDFSKQPGGPEEDAGSSYITINIVNGSDVARAEDDATYENGLPAENDVKSVTFFFFHANGQVAAVKGNGDYFFTPKEVVVGSTSEDDNIEKIMKATIVIDSTDGDLLPAGIVAVVNPSAALLAKLTTLGTNGTIDDFYQVMDYSDVSQSFLMSNSVYVDKENNNKHTRATYVSPEDYRHKKEDAEANPVDIYVERVVAKVRVASTLTPVDDMPGFYDTGITYTDVTRNEENGNITENNGPKSIYVKLYNWNVTATTDESHLIKKVNPAWELNIFQKNNEPWTNPARFRSFWAVNPDNVDIQYGDYDAANVVPFTGTNWTYLQENAAEDLTAGSVTKTPSDVIIAGQLFNEDGDVLGLADVGGMLHVVEYENATVNGGVAKTSANGETTIKEAILSFLTPMIWDVTDLLSEGDGDKEAHTILPEDVKVLTGTQMNEMGVSGAKEYKVYIQLTDDAKAKKWSLKNSANVTEDDVMTVDKVNEELFLLGGAKVWTAGLTYYYFPIRHLGPVPTTKTKEDGTKYEEGQVGTWGVVRNHIYDANITELKGLGTPIFDPKEIIHPQHPDVDETFIAARINILSWRIVTDDVKLEW